MVLASVVLAVLTGTVAWGIRQARLAREALDRAVAAERAATQAQASPDQSSGPLRGKAEILRDEALQRAARRDPKAEAERIRKLYEEIDTLMHIQDGIQQDLRGLRRQMPGPAATPAAAGGTTPAPEPAPNAAPPGPAGKASNPGFPVPETVIYKK
jgi:hypothetical protein